MADEDVPGVVEYLGCYLWVIGSASVLFWGTIIWLIFTWAL
jgi:hypothetical protein